MANAVSKIRSILKDHVGEITASQIADKTRLDSSEISMALCYLLRCNAVTRRLVPNCNLRRGRRNIWSYVSA